MRHFEATGSKYPLVVKLGTITPSGADVFSYAPDENDMVTDAKLVSSACPKCLASQVLSTGHKPSTCFACLRHPVASLSAESGPLRDQSACRVCAV